jgi:hypothetical protein
VNCTNVTELIQPIPWFVLEEEHVDQSIIALAMQDIQEINVNFQIVLGKILQIPRCVMAMEVVIPLTIVLVILNIQEFSVNLHHAF